MMDDLPRRPLTELLTGIIDNRGKTVPVCDAGIPLIATNCIKPDALYPVFEKVRYVAQDVYRSWFRGHPEPGDIIIVNKGTPGRVCLVPDPISFCIAQDMVALQVDGRRIYPRYLFAYMRSHEFMRQVESLHVGSLIPHLKKSHFRLLEIPIPPPEAQANIGDNYYLLSAKIELNRRMVATLEEMARAIYKSWFVDFDPVRAKVRAKAEGRDPERAAMAAICGRSEAELNRFAPEALASLASTSAMFPDGLRGSSWGPVPASWSTAKCGDLFHLEKGLSYKGEYLTPTGVPMVNLGCFKGSGVFDSSATKPYSGDYQARHTVRPGDLVLANTDITQNRQVIGSPGVVPRQGDYDCLLFSHHVYAVRFHESQDVWKAYVLYRMLQPDFRERAQGYATGTTVLALPRDAVLDCPILTPGDEIRDRFNDVANAVHKLVVSLTAQNVTLAAARDALLPRLLADGFSTEVPVG